ncbi:putative deacetylase LmbE-like domain-containing protein [Aspergillus heterothallicus]
MARLTRILRRSARQVRKHGWGRLLVAMLAETTSAALVLYLLLAHYLADDPRLIPDTVRYARNIVFITAHPDDETLFFSPTILYHGHDPRVTRSLLVISSEIHNSCAALAIAQERCVVLDRPDLQDNPKKWWDESSIRAVFEPYLKTWEADLIVTFDHGGISGHINHRAVSAAVRDYVLTTADAPPAFMLRSTALLRKYSSLLDLIPTTIPFSWRIVKALVLPRLDSRSTGPRYNTALIVSPWHTYLQSRTAFGKHDSQYSWDRVLYLVVSRYMWFNTLERVA